MREAAERSDGSCCLVPGKADSLFLFSIKFCHSFSPPVVHIDSSDSRLFSLLRLQGNVHVRTKALAAFQTLDESAAPRVLMLSILNSAAGANLTKATHVLLLDPVKALEEAAYAREVQAIGRALRQAMRTGRPCEVVRFVVKQTIEHDILQRNQRVKMLMEAARAGHCQMTRGPPSVPAPQSLQSDLVLSPSQPHFTPRGTPGPL